MFDPTLLTGLLAPAWVPSMPELIVILVIGLLLFGRKLPEIGRSLGQGIRQFKSGLNEVADQAIPPTQAAQPPPPPMPQAMYQTGQQPAVPPGANPYYGYYPPPPGYYPPQQQPLGPDGKPLPPPPPGYGYYPLPPQPQTQPSGIQPPNNTSQRG